MIVKERNPTEHPAPANPTAKVGVEAEQQLAFYLRRAFSHLAEIAVFNDLRLVDIHGEVAQIDHLILHPLGFVVVESKSITGTVRINAQREWIRVAARREAGMPDAVQQARLQRDVLRRLLTSHASTLRRGVPTGFARLGFDVLAAISDKGIIEREVPLPKVVKADQVPSTIKRIVAERKRLAEESGSGDAGGRGTAALLTQSEFRRICSFLLESHRPRRSASASSPLPRPNRTAPARPVVTSTRKAKRTPSPPRRSVPTVPPDATLICPQCTGTTLEMRWGERPKGYYSHCLGCGKNWRPDQICPGCRRPNVPLRKSKDVMLLECTGTGGCGYAGIFHRNP